MYRGKWLEIQRGSKRNFSITTRLEMEEDIMARIEKLMSKNKEYQEIHKEDSIKTKQNLELENKHLELDSIIKSRVFLLKESIRTAQKAADINKEENEKLLNNNSNLTSMQKLIKDKLDKLEEADNPDIIEVYKLQNAYNKVVVNNLEKAEAIVEAPVWRKINEGSSQINPLSFYAAKANHVKEKENFEKDFNKCKSEIKKMEEESNSKKESPMDFAVEKLESDMPSYTDPED
jgi:hypothetical protein